MIDNGVILKNPLVPEGFYFAQVIAVETEPVATSAIPKLLIQLRLHTSYGLPSDSVFSAILHPTERSMWHYVNFFNTFMLMDPIDQPTKAIGCWGSVRIRPSKFNGIEYSTVKFVYQPLAIRMKSWKLGLEDAES